MTTNKVPVALRIAGLLHFLWALLFGVVVGLQLLAVVLGLPEASLANAAWNLAVVICYVLMGRGCWRVEPWVLSWSTTTNTLNALFGLMGGLNILSILVPLELAMIVLVRRSKDALAPTVPRTAAPGTIAKAADDRLPVNRSLAAALSLCGLLVALFTLGALISPVTAESTLVDLAKALAAGKASRFDEIVDVDALATDAVAGVNRKRASMNTSVPHSEFSGLPKISPAEAVWRLEALRAAHGLEPIALPAGQHEENCARTARELADALRKVAGDRFSVGDGEHALTTLFARLRDRLAKGGEPHVYPYGPPAYDEMLGDASFRYPVTLFLEKTDRGYRVVRVEGKLWREQMERSYSKDKPFGSKLAMR